MYCLTINANGFDNYSAYPLQYFLRTVYTHIVVILHNVIHTVRTYNHIYVCIQLTSNGFVTFGMVLGIMIREGNHCGTVTVGRFKDLHGGHGKWRLKTCGNICPYVSKNKQL